MNRLSKLISNPRVLCMGALAVSLLVQTQAFADTGLDSDFDKVTENVKGVLFGKGIRKAGLALGFGAGLFQAFMSGSIRPLLIYGGLGLAVCYLPTIVDWIGGLNVPGV